MSAAPAEAPARAPARRTVRRPVTGARADGSPRAKRPATPATSAAARRRRRSRAPLVVLSGLVIGGLLVGIVTIQALISQTSFRMQALQAHTRVLQLQYAELKARAATLSAPSRVAAVARRRGMVLPDAAQVQTLRVAGVPSSPAPPSSGQAPPSSGLKPVIGEEP